MQRAVDFLDSPDIAIDDRHGPRLYSRFIRGLLARVRDRPPVQLVRRSSRRNAAKTRVSQAAPEAPTSAMQNIPAAATIQMAAPQPPQHPMTSDHYASAFTGQELYMQPSYLGEMDGLGLAAADFFRQPMPFELEFLQSMQSISSLSDMMPGECTSRVNGCIILPEALSRVRLDGTDAATGKCPSTNELPLTSWFCQGRLTRCFLAHYCIANVLLVYP